MEFVCHCGGSVGEKATDFVAFRWIVKQKLSKTSTDSIMFSVTVLNVLRDINIIYNVLTDINTYNVFRYINR